MRLGIDARFYGPIGKGLGRYTQEVVDNIIKITNAAPPVSGRGVFDYVVFLSPDNFDEFPEGRGIKKVKVPFRWYSWQEQIFFPFYLWREKLDLVHFPHFNVPLLAPKRFVVTIHDLILTHFPTLRATTRSHWIYFLKNLVYRLVIFSALHRSLKIITVSEHAKCDIIEQFKIKPEKIKVTYEGVANLAKGRDSLFVSKLDSSETLAQYNIPKDFLLYVGNAYPHKNLEALLEVFSRLRLERPDLRLVLVGKIDYFYERVRAAAKDLNLWRAGDPESPVIFPGYVPDAQLEIFYAAARAYVFPSLYEGFGLPPLEAMAKGCPVASSNRASLPEILGDAALYFNPEDQEDMLFKIRLLLEDGNLRNELIARGREQVKKYSWWECARQTLEIYQEVLREKNK
ncbi:MAG: glycosyltransferase family 1 protein [Patescibacteria group bacterium]